jgi:hypothetical protein
MTRDDIGLSPLDSSIVVPFVPFRCPRCGKHKPLTYGRRGTLRYHLCRACGCKYRSREILVRDLDKWRARVSGTESTGRQP